MKNTKFPTLEEALYLHGLMVKRFGGADGILDRGLLESALARPRSGYYNTLSAQAAALMHSIVRNHAFVDGNKRMSLALTATFLLMNGYELKSSADESETFILQLAATDQPLRLITEWIERHITKA